MDMPRASGRRTEGAGDTNQHYILHRSTVSTVHPARVVDKRHASQVRRSPQVRKWDGGRRIGERSQGQRTGQGPRAKRFLDLVGLQRPHCRAAAGEESERKKSTLRCEGLSGGRVLGAVVMAVVERPPRVAGGRSVRQLVITYRIVANFQENLVLRYRYIKVAVA